MRSGLETGKLSPIKPESIRGIFLSGCQLRFKEQTTVCQALIPNAIAVTKHPMNAQKTGSRNIDFILTSPLSREI